MAKKEKAKKSREKTTALAVKEEKLIWAGAKDLFGKSESEQHKYKKDSLVVTAQALTITPFGVNILGGLPYINNLGLKDKMDQYHKGATFEYNWVKRSEDDTDKAICEVRIVQGKKILTPWVVGEASPASMKMGTLKGYQNHLAQTRAENRCVRMLDGVRIHKELLTNLGKMHEKGEVDPETAGKAAQAASVTAEEMNVEREDKRPAPYLPAKSEKSDPVQIAANTINGTTSKVTLKSIEARVKELVAKGEFSKSNETYLLGLIKKRLGQI